MSLSWLRLGSGTVNQAVPTAALPCRESLGCCKTKACICIKALCCQSQLLVLPPESSVSVHSTGTASPWNPTQVREQSVAEKSSDQLRLPMKRDALLLSRAQDPPLIFGDCSSRWSPACWKYLWILGVFTALMSFPFWEQGSPGHASASFRLTGFRNFSSREAGTGLITEVGHTDASVIAE